MSPSRDFKGIWFPREIWLHPELKPLDKIVWAEVHSLYNREKGGCYAKNDYLSKFTHTTPKKVGQIITKLKKLGLIKQVSFNGRIRVLKALFPEEDFSQEQHESQSSHAEKEHSSHAEKEHSRWKKKGTADLPFFSPYYSSSSKKSIKEKKEKEGSQDVANAPPIDPAVLNFGPYVRLKKEELEKLKVDFGEKEVMSMIEDINNYLKSTGNKPYKDYDATLRRWFKTAGVQPNSPAAPPDPEIDQKKALIEKKLEHAIKHPQAWIGKISKTEDGSMECWQSSPTRQHFASKNLPLHDLEKKINSWMKEGWSDDGESS